MTTETLVKMTAQIEAMATLPEGWDTYDAPPPGEMSRSLAVKLLNRLQALGMEPTKVSASAEGGVFVLFAGHGRKTGNIECFDTGEVLAATSGDDAGVSVWAVGDDESLRETVERIRAFIR